MLDEAQLQSVIESVVDAMQSDYQNSFARRYGTPGLIADLKKQIFYAVSQFPISCVIDAYEKWTDDFPSKMPACIDIARYVAAEDAGSASTQQGVTKEKSSPAVQCNPIQMLRDALENSGQVQLEQRLREQESLIARHYAQGKIRHRIHDDSDLDPRRHDCTYGGCVQPGVMSAGVAGGGRFYCREHYYKMIGG